MLKPPKKGALIGIYATVNEMELTATLTVKDGKQEQDAPRTMGFFVPAKVMHGKQFGTLLLNKYPCADKKIT